VNFHAEKMEKAIGSQRGLSLLELMVALSLGAFLMLGLVNMFLSSRTSSQVETALARVQENGRAALGMVSRDVLRARYKGCNSVRGEVTVLAKNADYDGLRGYERASGAWQPDTSATAISQVLTTARDGSDVLNLQTGLTLGRELLTSDVTPSDTAISISDNPDGIVKKDDLILLSGCLTAHLLKVTNTPASTGATTIEYAVSGNTSSTVEPGYRYNAGTELMIFENVIWYVADTGRDKNGYDVWALYRTAAGATPTQDNEIIEGVENMQILYGERGASGTRFVDATKVTDWDSVVAVRIAMLIQTYEPVRDQDDVSAYSLLDKAVSSSSTPAHSGGRALRKVFSTTLALRNTGYDL